MGFLTTHDDVAAGVARLRHLFVNLYLVDGSDGFVVIDGGLPGAADDIVDLAQERYGAGAAPSAVVLTHGHFDHVGAFPTLFETWDVPVYAHPREIDHLTGLRDYPPPDPSVGEGAMALMSFAYPDKAIDLGDRVRQLPADGSVPGLPGWRWVDSPGHTDGHVSLFRDEDRCLIAGDAFVTVKQESLYAVLTQDQELHGPPAYFTPDWLAAEESVRRLAALEPAVAATGHGTPMRGERLAQDLARLARDFRELAVPRQGRYVPAGMATPE